MYAGRSRALLVVAALICSAFVTTGVSAGTARAASSSKCSVTGSSSKLVAKTDRGAVKGTNRDGVRAWKGVPFAAPPVGKLRWRGTHHARVLEGCSRRHQVRRAVPAARRQRHRERQRGLSEAQRVATRRRDEAARGDGVRARRRPSAGIGLAGHGRGHALRRCHARVEGQRRCRHHRVPARDARLAR